MTGSSKRPNRAQNRIPELPICNALAADSNRATVLLGAAFIEYKLEQLLTAYFRKQIHQASRGKESNSKEIERLLVSSGAPPLLGSMWAKTEIAFACGLIEREVRDAISELRDYRNYLAHLPGPADLRDDRVEAIIGKFSAPRFRQQIDNWASGDLEGTGLGFWKQFCKTPGVTFSNPRLRLMSVVFVMYCDLTCRIEEYETPAERVERETLERANVRKVAEHSHPPLPDSSSS